MTRISPDILSRAWLMLMVLSGGSAVVAALVGSGLDRRLAGTLIILLALFKARIILSRLPDIDTELALQIANMVSLIRKEELRKSPGVAETLDWAATLTGLDIRHLRDEPETVHETLMCLPRTNPA